MATSLNHIEMADRIEVTFRALKSDQTKNGRGGNGLTNATSRKRYGKDTGLGSGGEFEVMSSRLWQFTPHHALPGNALLTIKIVGGGV